MRLQTGDGVICCVGDNSVKIGIIAAMGVHKDTHDVHYKVLFSKENEGDIMIIQEKDIMGKFTPIKMLKTHNVKTMMIRFFLVKFNTLLSLVAIFLLGYLVATLRR